MYHDTDGRGDCQRHRIRDTVIDMDKLHIKTAETDVIARFFRKDLSVFQKIPFFQLQLNDGVGQCGSVNGDM